MAEFNLVADFQPTGDQPAAIDRLADGLAHGLRHQTLLGATGTGKTYTIANAIARHGKPTLVLAHNKTLAAQLYAEFREFFPDNAVEYFVSYFDYYQPEAYLPADGRPGRRPPGRFDRDRPPAGRGRRRHRPIAQGRRTARLRGAPLLGALLVPVRRHDDRRARAAQLLVQLAPRRLPGLHRAGHAARGGSRPRGAGPVAVDRRRARSSARGPGCRWPTRGSARSPRRSARAHGWDPTIPVRDLPPEALDYLLNAPKGEQVVIGYRHERGENTYTANFEGIVPNLERRYRETDSEYVKTELERFMVTRPCPTCGGKRLRPEVLAVTVDGRNIHDVSTLSITDALAWIEAVSARLTEREQAIARQVVKEIAARLGFLVDVGLDYLTIDRTSQTLSGGEAQRIRLATQIGAGLMGVLYILDEPSIGLHQRDNAKLIATLTRLRDLGNTVLVVEHDEETIRTADWIVDIGPGRRRARRRGHRQRDARDAPRRASLDHRRLPARRADGRRSRPTRRAGQRQGARRPRSARPQPQADRRDASRSAGSSR